MILVWKTRDTLRLVLLGNDRDGEFWEALEEECDERVGYCWLVAWLVVSHLSIGAKSLAAALLCLFGAGCGGVDC